MISNYAKFSNKPRLLALVNDFPHFVADALKSPTITFGLRPFAFKTNPCNISTNTGNIRLGGVWQL